ncbi:hypothetical protein GCM10028778_26950 [Barrientosiimonas marina]
MVNLEFVNLVPKFLNFFELANHEDVNKTEQGTGWFDSSTVRRDCIIRSLI